MARRITAILGLCLLSAPTVAAAEDKLEPRVQAMLACASISASDARLQCYDQAIAPLKQALDQGRVVLKEKKAPLAREGVVKASGRSGERRFWVVLENGDRWAISPSEYRREPPPAGSVVKLRRTLMGSYWLSGTRWPESEAEYLGNVTDTP